MTQPAASRIRILNGPYRGREKTIVPDGKRFTIGRDPEASVQILDRGASRFHCEIFPVGGMLFVRDLESKNGTYVNDERLGDEELLRPGDVIRIGKSELVYESGSALSDDDSSNRISYQDDPDLLSNTLEFRIDELSDLSDPQDSTPVKDANKGLRILYQIARVLADAGSDHDGDARAMDTLIQAMPAESGLVFLRDLASGKLMPVTVRTATPHTQPVISRSIVKKTFTENKAIHSADAREDGRFDRNASIHSKDIRSVICVPLAVAGQTRGVVYLSRGLGQPAFDQLDLELISAVALQIGQRHAGLTALAAHDAATDQLCGAWAAAIDAVVPPAGKSGRAAAAAKALALALGLDAVGQQRLRRAGWLTGAFQGAADSPARFAAFDAVPGMAEATVLAHHAHERIDGSGPRKLSGDDIDTECRAVAVATVFAQLSAAAPEQDANEILSAMGTDPGLDKTLVLLLQGCHLDGSLYK